MGEGQPLGVVDRPSQTGEAHLVGEQFEEEHRVNFQTQRRPVPQLQDVGGGDPQARPPVSARPPDEIHGFERVRTGPAMLGGRVQYIA